MLKQSGLKKMLLTSNPKIIELKQVEVNEADTPKKLKLKKKNKWQNKTNN